MNRAFKALTHADEEDEAADTLTLRESLELSDISTVLVARQTNNEYISSAVGTLKRIYEYCVYDSDACRLLWAKRNLVYQ
jgi:hypothetical protein